jgi:preprotein translocase subunit SecA
MRGLCMALLDEADSILLDEAEVPLILSRAAPQAARRAFLWQALALARRLDEGRDFVLHRADRVATLTPAGEERVATLANGLGGPWQRPRYRREAVHVALVGLHACRRDEHYLVRDGRIDLLDEVTGRVAVGRFWSRGLHTVVALKEGLAAPTETETVAQTTFQRFFQRYWRLGGISGTLCEARAELREVYGASIVRIPLHRPCIRQMLPLRRFEGANAMFDAVVERVAALQAEGRPVLVGTDSVADSQRVSERLGCHGIEHRVLNALQDADEATIVAEAGRSGRVTVATRMAGRGTDIELDEAARAAGGLHVISCQNNTSRRLDRQLAGRAGRQGDPGSTETWLLPRTFSPRAVRSVDTINAWTPSTHIDRSQWLALLHRRWIQWREERRRAAVRRHLLEQDVHWERRLSFAGPPS